MKLDWRLLVVMLLSLGLMVGCTNDDDDDTTGPDDQTSAFTLLTEYMAANNMDSPTVISGWITTASAVDADKDNLYIVDVRSADAYAAGHIEGAVWSDYADIVTTVENGNLDDKPVVVACYSGQKAAHAVVALRLSGYDDAKSLMWGMSGWTSLLDSWSGSIDSFAVGHANWSFDAAPALPSGNEDPVIDTDLTDGQAILAERVDVILETFRGTAATTIVEAPENYQIINYWGADDYNHYGHIASAYQVTPGTLSIADDGLDILDPSMQIATYCWTGQTSSMMTAWLTALGYDATSLKNGANSMIYNQLAGHKWAPLDPANDLPLVQ